MNNWEIVVNWRGIVIVCLVGACVFVGRLVFDVYSTFSEEIKETLGWLKTIWVFSDPIEERYFAVFILGVIAVMVAFLMKCVFLGLEALKGQERVHVDRGVFVEGEQGNQNGE